MLGFAVFGMWLVWQSAWIRPRFQNQVVSMARHLTRSIGAILARIIFTDIAVAASVKTEPPRVQIFEKIVISQPLVGIIPQNWMVLNSLGCKEPVKTKLGPGSSSI